MFNKWSKVIFHHKLSSVSTIFAISITVAIIMVFSQMVAGLLGSYEEIRLESSNFDWAYSKLTGSEMSTLREAVNSDDVDVRGMVLENHVGNYMDDLGLEVEWLEVEGDLDTIFGARVVSGRMPQSSDEVCITQTYLDRTGLDIGIGDAVSASVFTDGPDTIEKHATVVGILDHYVSLRSSYCTLSATASDPADASNRTYTAYFLASQKAADYVAINAAFNRMTCLLTGQTGETSYLALEPKGIELISRNVMGAQINTKEQSVHFLIPAILIISTLFIIISVLFVRILVGVMLALRKRDYGVLLALGLSRKRMKSLLLFEAGIFTASSALLGLPLGAGLFRLSYNVLRRLTAAGHASQTWSWGASALAILVVFGGVALAYALLYANISKNQPYTYFEQSKDTATVVTKKKPAKGNGILFFAQRNLERNAGRTFGVLLVLFVSSSLVMASICMLSLLKGESVNFLENYAGSLSSDFSLVAAADNGQTFSGEMIEITEKLDGIEAVYPVWNAPVMVNDMPGTVCVYTETQMKGAGLSVQDSPLLYAMDMSAVSFSGYQPYVFTPQEDVVLTGIDGAHTVETSICDLVPYNMFYAEGLYKQEKLICNEAFKEAYLEDVTLQCSTILVKTDLSYMALQKALEANPLWSNGSDISFWKYGMTEIENQIESIAAVMGLFGITLMFFVFVCLVNITHQLCLLRSKEYAMLQAVGYRKRDISHIASMEMTLISLLANAFAFVGAYILFTIITKNTDVKFPVLWCGLYTGSVVLLTWISSLLVCRSVLKKSMYERLCEVER